MPTREVKPDQQPGVSVQQGIRLVETVSNWEARLNSIAIRASEGIEKYWHILVFCFSIGYFSDAIFRADRKLYWFDELFTVYLSRLPDFKNLWQVLTAGVDLNPPLLYIFTKLSNRLLGENQVSVRLPEIIGFWIFCLCLFWFVKKRSSALSGFLSMLFPIVTLAYWYADEARPYGIEMGFCGLALVSWQAAAVRDSARLAWLLGLGASLAGALLSHGYGCLTFFPLIAGQAAHTFQRKKVDWVLWLTIAISSTAILASLPQAIALKHVVIPGTVLPPSLALLIATSLACLKPAAYVVLGWLGLMSVEWSSKGVRSSQSRAGPQFHEMVALIAFLAVPALQYLLAKLTSGPLISRYSIFWVASPACLLGFATVRRPLAALGTLALLLIQMGVNSHKAVSSLTVVEPSGYPVPTSISAFRERFPWLQEAASDTAPIAVLNSLDFLPAVFYGPPSLTPRLTYVMLKTPDRTGVFLDNLRHCCVSAITSPVSLSAFIAAHKTFLAYGGLVHLTELNDLVGQDATVALERISGDEFLVSVTQRGTIPNGRRVNRGK